MSKIPRLTNYCAKCKKGIHNKENQTLRCDGKDCECLCRVYYQSKHDGAFVKHDTFDDYEGRKQAVQKDEERWKEKTKAEIERNVARRNAPKEVKKDEDGKKI